MAEIKIISNGLASGTKIYVEGKLIEGCTHFEFIADADTELCKMNVTYSPALIKSGQILGAESEESEQ